MEEDYPGNRVFSLHYFFATTPDPFLLPLTFS